MPLRIIRQDITKMNVDAVVNAANESLLGGGGVDGAIHRAAGEGLLAECKKLGGCKVGEAKSTRGYNLPAKFVIHTVGPIYNDGRHGEAGLLASCYEKSLAEAKRLGCKSVAFPLISSGAFCYPKKQALRIAINCITDFLFENRMEVYICIWSEEVVGIVQQLYPDLEEFINSNYVAEHTESQEERFRSRMQSEKDFRLRHRQNNAAGLDAAQQKSAHKKARSWIYWGDEITEEEIAEVLDTQYENRFPELLKRLMKEKDLKAADVWLHSNLRKQLFYNLFSEDYHTEKATVLALAFGLQLDLEELDALLEAAGYTRSTADTRELVAEYFLSLGNFNIMELNAVLEMKGLAPLGTKPRKDTV